jgi:hypothetical protein
MPHHQGSDRDQRAGRRDPVRPRGPRRRARLRAFQAQRRAPARGHPPRRGQGIPRPARAARLQPDTRQEAPQGGADAGPEGVEPEHIPLQDTDRTRQPAHQAVQNLPVPLPKQAAQAPDAAVTGLRHL